jgi:hypothetical protein
MDIEQASTVTVEDVVTFLANRGACDERQCVRDFDSLEEAWIGLRPYYMRYWLYASGAEHADMCENIHYAVEQFCEANNIRGSRLDELDSAIIRQIYPTWFSGFKENSHDAQELLDVVARRREANAEKNRRDMREQAAKVEREAERKRELRRKREELEAARPPQRSDINLSR